MSKLYQPSTLLQLLDDLNIKPKKSLSQNFLVDGNVVKKILKKADVHARDTILEIGPGPGVLTEALLEKGAKVIAVEKDHTFAEALQRFKNPNLQINEQDFLKYPLEDLKGCFKNIKVIANLPYSITTPILSKLFSHHDLFSSYTIMVQKELAYRICAKPNTKDYSSISLYTSFYTDPEVAFQVSKNCFIPSPKVDSAILHLSSKKTAPIDIDHFFQFTRAAFGQKRKMLSSSLKTFCDKEGIQEALYQIGLSKQARPGELSLQEFIELFKTVPLKSL